jgi:hypothetical protein
MTTSYAQQTAPQRTYSAKTYCALLEEAEKGLADVAAGRSSDARTSILAIQARRSAAQIHDALRHKSTNPL